MASCHDPGKSRSYYADLIKQLNDLIADGVCTAGNTLTQNITALTTERDNQ